MTFISANRLYIFFVARSLFFLSKIAGPVSQVIVIHREHVRTDRDGDDDDDDDLGTRTSRVSPRDGIRFFSPSRRVSPPPDRVCVPGRQKRATLCQKSRYVNAPRKPSLDRAAAAAAVAVLLVTGIQDESCNSITL